MTLVRTTTLGAAVIALGCELADGGATSPLRSLDRTAFALEAGPILAERCGASLCHGNRVRPFALYAPGQHRRPPTTTYAKLPLDAAELDANYEATLGFLDSQRGTDTTLIRKALGVGGVGGHGGGAIFEAPSDPECRALRAWIGGLP